MEKRVSDKMWVIKGANPKLAEWKILRTQRGWGIRAGKSYFDKTAQAWKESEWLDEDDVRNLVDLAGEALDLHMRLSEGRVSTDNSALPAVKASWEDDDIPF